MVRLPLLDAPDLRHVQVEVECDGKRLRMLWDTGAPRTVTTQAHRGQVHVQGLDLGVVPDTMAVPHVPHLHGPPLDGILGADAMAGRAWLVDMPNRTLTVGTSEALATHFDRGVAITARTIAGGRVWSLPIEVDGQPALGFLDSGAHRCVGTRALGALLDPSAPRQRVAVSSPTATAVDSVRTRARRIDVAGLVAEDVPVVIAPAIFDVAPAFKDRAAMLVGVDLLGDRCYGFDFARGLFAVAS